MPNLFCNVSLTCAANTPFQQGGTSNSPIQAIPAAISTKTSLLLGMWASAGDASFANEIAALKSAIATYGSQLNGLVAGISVGSEDLYRISPTGILNKENPGVGPDVLVNYIKQVRDAIAGTPLSGVPVGHVDTWTAWVNSSNDAVISASDWLGVDAYPYFQTTMANAIANGASLFNDAFGQTKAAAKGKEVWVTETGWPVSGPAANQADASLDNAKTYWDDVGCQTLFGKTNTWWYTLQDAAPTTPAPSFGVVGSTLSTTPLYDLSCNASSSSSSSSAAGSGNTATASGGGAATAVAPSAAATASGADGGSPGISAGAGSVVTVGGTGAGGSAATATLPGTPTNPTGGAGGSGSGGSSGNGGSGSGSGSGSAGGNGTVSGSSPSASTTAVITNAAPANLFSFGAAFVAVLAACMIL